MGLKTTNYRVEDLGITIPTAYAQLVRVSVDAKGRASGTFKIQQTRSDIDAKDTLADAHIHCKVDKTQPIFEQVYNAAKEKLFKGWEDDIVDETETV